MFRMRLLISMLAILTSACAMQDEGLFSREEGWREGRVVELGSASELKKYASSDCREASGANLPASTLFATVAYRGFRMTHHRIVPIPKGMAPKEGDLVRVNLDVCANALVIGNGK